MDRIKLVTPQPKPLPGKEYVRDKVNKFCKSLSPNFYTGVERDCLAKMAAGEAKYGSALMTHNGRNADLDAYQDLLDTINYTIQGYYEEIDLFDRQDRADEISYLFLAAVRIRKRLLSKGIFTDS